MCGGGGRGYSHIRAVRVCAARKPPIFRPRPLLKTPLFRPGPHRKTPLFKNIHLFVPLFRHGLLQKTPLLKVYVSLLFLVPPLPPRFLVRGRSESHLLMCFPSFFFLCLSSCLLCFNPRLPYRTLPNPPLHFSTIHYSRIPSAPLCSSPLSLPILRSHPLELPYPIPCPALPSSHLNSSPPLSSPLPYLTLSSHLIPSSPYPHISFAPFPPHYHTLHSPRLPYHPLRALLYAPCPLVPAPPHPFHTFLPLASPPLPSPSSLPSSFSRPSPRILYPTFLHSLSYSTPPLLHSHRLPSPPLVPLPFPTRSHTLPYPSSPHPSLTSPTLLYLPYSTLYATVSSPPLRYLRCLSVCLSICLSARTLIGLAGRRTDSDTDSAHVLVYRQTVGRTDWQIDK